MGLRRLCFVWKGVVEPSPPVPCASSADSQPAVRGCRKDECTAAESSLVLPACSLSAADSRACPKHLRGCDVGP